jgi:hypothetical protein
MPGARRRYLSAAQRLMTSRTRNTVGVYDRPHPLRTRKVLLPTAIAVVVGLGYAAWFFLH